MHDSNYPVKADTCIIILDALATLGIRKNIMHQFSVWTVLPKFCIVRRNGTPSSFTQVVAFSL